MPRIHVWGRPKTMVYPDIMHKHEQSWIAIVAEELGVFEKEIEVLWSIPERWSNEKRDYTLSIEFSVGPFGHLRTADPKKIRSLRDAMLRVLREAGLNASVWVRPIHDGCFGTTDEDMMTKDEYFALEDQYATVPSHSDEFRELVGKVGQARQNHQDWWKEYQKYHPNAA